VRPALANIITARVPEADLLIDTMTVRPQGNRAFLISDTIRRLKAADIWAKLDVLWMLAAHDAQAGRLNWKAPASFALTAVNSPTFTADRGYQGDGSTSYLNTGWNPATNGVNYTLNSACTGVYHNTTGGAGNDAHVSMGSSDLTNASFIVAHAGSSGNIMRVRVNTATSYNGTATITTRVGLTVADRSSSILTTLYRDAVAVDTTSNASSAIASQPVYLLTLNVAGSPGATNYTTARLATAFNGASLTTTQHTALHAINNAYLNSMGAA